MKPITSAEKLRIEECTNKKTPWKKWGPYLTERQWGTVREDYSPDGSAWNSVTHDMARSKAYRWGEEGIGGISDDSQLLCFAVSLWNQKDPILKERMFGLNGNEGNHGEDVKEYYYYLDSTPTHSYMKMLYKYPHAEFPYSQLVDENKKRSRQEEEFELIDTGVFSEDKYFDVMVEYAKNDCEDLLIRIEIHNRSKEKAAIHLLPTIWFRNTWSWGYDAYTPSMQSDRKGEIKITHKALGEYFFYTDKKVDLLFCNNETNFKKLYQSENKSEYFKDGINEYIV
ncbi:MAG TPA: glucosidase, partial [Bacteroidia bacterium]|nr:glucosidase [Bacteroidia bacterium]